MSFKERAEILDSIQYIDFVIEFDDSDDTATDLIKNIAKKYSHISKVCFGNGGDRIDSTTPEFTYCKNNNIEMIWNLGGGKIQSSSDLLKGW